MTALCGFAPVGPKENLYNYVVYFSCMFDIAFDPVTMRPKRASRPFFSKRLRAVGRDFVVISFVISILNKHDYEFFDTKLLAHLLEHSLVDLFA